MLNKKSKLSILSKTLMTIFAMGGVIYNSNFVIAQTSPGEGIEGLGGIKIVGSENGMVPEHFEVKDEKIENGVATHGGAILVFQGSSFTAIGVNEEVSKFENNTAFDRGGAIYNGLPTFYIDDNHHANPSGVISSSITSVSGYGFKNNSAGSFGGAVYNDPGSTYKSENNTYESNTAGFIGGALLNGDGRVITSSGEEVNATIELNGNNTFVFNKAQRGGAIANLGYLKDSEASYTEFNGNSSDLQGGAIANINYLPLPGGPEYLYPASNLSDSVIHLIGTVVFTSNTAAAGGAIANFSWNTSEEKKKTYMLFEGKTTFKDNQSTGYGGAIYNADAEIQLIGKQDFFGNTAASCGGAIASEGYYYKDGTSLTISGETFFIGNKGAWGGAIYNAASTARIDSATFENNQATGGKGGAIHNGGNNSFYIGTAEVRNSLFQGNSTVISSEGSFERSGGGAIMNFTDSKFDSFDNKFLENDAATFGGAIHNAKGESTQLTLHGRNSFDSNKSELGGGAIYNQGLLEDSDLNNLTEFRSNTSKNGFGGAFANIRYEVDGQNKTIANFKGAVIFEGNRSKDSGGAIYNDADLNFGQNNHVFTGNISESGEGGAIFNSEAGAISFGGNNIFESNTANGEANDIFNNGQIDFGGENNTHNITVLNAGVNGSGKLSLNNGSLVLGAGAQIHQGSFTAKAGTMTTVVLSNAHHVHDKNVAHFDELTDENGTGHDKVATAVSNGGFGIHTTGHMTLEKGAVLNIVSDDIQAGHTYLVAYNEKAPEDTAAKMARAADTSGVINPSGIDQEDTSWEDNNLIISNQIVKLERVGGDNTNGYILVTAKDSNSVNIIQDLAGLDQVYFSWLSDLEDLRQRLGEVRLGADNGIWTKVSYARYRASGLGDGKVKSTDYSIHVGADGTLYKNNGHKFFAGFSFKGGHTDMKAARAAGTGDLNHYTWKLYGTYVHEKGSYADIVASVGTFNNRFRGYHDSWTGNVHGDVNNWGAGISGEVGHQFRFFEESAGSFWFAEPQIQLSYFRVKGKNYETSNAIHVEQKSVNFLTGRVGVSAGKQFAYGADKKRYLQLSAKAGLIHEFAGDQKLRLNEKKLSADGKKNLFYYGADMDWQFADNHKLYLKVDRATGSGYRKDIQIQGGYRYSF